MKTLVNRTVAAALALSAGALSSPTFAQDVVVPANTTWVILTDMLPMPLVLDSLLLKPGSTLKLVGTQPVVLVARDSVALNGRLDFSGLDAPTVNYPTFPTSPAVGGLGQTSGATGGAGSPLTVQSSPAGATGMASIFSPVLGGGHGGESSFGVLQAEKQRPGGGAGGQLGADVSIIGSPDDPANVGLVATEGDRGRNQSVGAISGISPSQGGALGASLFIDGNSDNNFWGSRSAGGVTVLGELFAPVSGTGGGGGGDVIVAPEFPQVPWNKQAWKREWVGGGGGGGAGLMLVFTPELVVGPTGRLLSEGGDGAAGESVAGGINNAAGGGGGGSGGMLVVQAQTIDLRLAGPEALSARGGAGGDGWFLGPEDVNGGGTGGPGLIQLHVADAADVLLAPGMSLTDVSAPAAKILDLLF